MTRHTWKLIALLAIIGVTLDLPPSIFAQSDGYQAPHDKPGPAADRVFFKSFHVDLASASMKAMPIIIGVCMRSAAFGLRPIDSIA